jgi:hypothetical protein
MIGSTVLALGLLVGVGQPAAAEPSTFESAAASEDDAGCVLVGYLLVPHDDHYDAIPVFACS